MNSGREQIGHCRHAGNNESADILGTVGAVVVDYNSGEAVQMCVQSLRDEGILNIVVVDNAKGVAFRETSVVGVTSCTVVGSGRNLGFGAGANFGFEHLDSEAVLVCNADVVFHPGSVLAMAQLLLGANETAIVGPRICDENGDTYPSARRFPDLFDAIGHAFVGPFWPNNPWSRRYTMAEWDHNGARYVDWVSGACFLTRRDAWQTLGGFDASFFMYAEDVDLCWRAHRSGWSVMYEPGAQVTHLQGISTRQKPLRMLLAHHRSLLRFANRTTFGWRRSLLPLIALGLGLRFAIMSARAFASMDRTNK